ncbi:MAG: VOC family protein [Gammaproteobacteria bacterium]|nr:VOC family protein [Gammaproteobacteria bacterium]
MNRPMAVPRLHHVALNVRDLESCERFYTELLGMCAEWRPDPDNVYLTGGTDNLALHRAPGAEPGPAQRLDHIGFVLNEIGEVDAWYLFLKSNNVPIVKEPRTHRDGARSFYCRDPDGNTVQMIYHPPLAGK